MKPFSWLIVGLIGLVVPPSTRAADPPKFAFHDGDRIVLIGDTLIERDQKYGYLETMLTLQDPDKHLIFRNLGWSGDTVYGLARARFGSPAEGFAHLKEHVLALKPTVLVVGYGMTESFDGAAGLPRFVSGLNALLDTLAETKARVVLLSPIVHADPGRPLPDPSAHNKDLERYAEAVGKVAADRGATFIDLFHEWEKVNAGAPETLTDNGIHLTDAGYRRFGLTVARELQGLPAPWNARFHHNGRLERATGTTVTIDPTQPGGVHFQARDATLPVPPQRLGSEGVEPRVLVAEGLPDGHYKLIVDGRPVKLRWESKLGPFRSGEKLATLPNVAQWAAGVEVLTGPEYDQVEQLRQTINEKNLLYFHRWRPQNETYLLGFRKHEQGNNAREIPLFDPLVEAKEQEVARLRKPLKHTYELVRESEAGK